MVRCLLVIALLALGCGPDDTAEPSAEGTGGGSGSSSGGEAATTGESSDDGIVTDAGTTTGEGETGAETMGATSDGADTTEGDPPSGLQHGSIAVEFSRGDGVDADPFVGTTVIELRLDYEACLVAFYEANPGWQPAGVDGSTVFAPLSEGGEGWEDRLCDGLGNIDCEVVSFTQQIDAAQGNFLSVLYSVTGPIEDGTLHFGPVPLDELSQCRDGTLPSVRVASNGAARGRDGLPPDGQVLWSIQQFNPAVAIADQMAPIMIRVEPVR
ncbi:MAG: hypothetical protein AAF721_21890 [Myxococcota bacterium]